MVDLSLGEQHEDVVYFCPECGSPSLDKKPLMLHTGDPSREEYSCRACEWLGVKSELIATPISHEFSSREDIVKAMMGDLRLVLAKSFAPTFGHFLVKWGFLDQPINPKQVGRYVAAIASTVLQTVILERRKMAEEKVQHERRGN